MVTGLFFSPCLSLRAPGGASSSRSRACRSGFWGLHLIPLRMYHTYPGWYVIPNSRAITWATRFGVHKSVGKTATLASFNRMPSNSFFCSAVSLGERPGWGLARKASSPPCFSCCFLRETKGEKHRSNGSLRERLCPPATAGSQSCGAFPMLLHYLWVS